MPNSRLRRAFFGFPAAAWRMGALAALGTMAISAQASAQWWRLGHKPDPWVLMLDGGGSYSVSDLEIVPGTDQNGGWLWDAGLRLEHGRGAIGIGYEGSRFDVGSDGASTTSGIYMNPRFYWTHNRRAIRPYVFTRLGDKYTRPSMIESGNGAVIVSDLDITSGLLGTSTYGIAGYEPKYASSFVTNLILWTINERGGAPQWSTTQPTEK